MEPVKRVRRGTETRQKMVVFGVRMTEAERAELESNATNAGLTPAAYVRKRTLGDRSSRPTRRASIDVQALTRLQGELNKAGSNIHQLTKRVNFGETPAGEEIRAAMADYRQAVAAILATLGRVGK